MTRKKSNVKALALAVTCAILAGGYSGLNPVYAAGDYGDYTVKYDATDNSLDYVIQNGASGYNTNGIYKIKLNNIVLDSSIGASPMITVGSYFSIDGSNGSISAADEKFKVSGDGAITATSLKLSGIDNVVTAINSKAALSDVQNNTNNIAGLENSKANKTDVYNKIESEGKFAGKDYEGKVDALETAVNDTSTGLVKKVGDLEGKTTNLSSDGTTLTNMTKVSATTLDVGGKVINAAKVEGYDAAVEKTANIKQNADGSTTVNDVTFKAGAVSGVKSINDKIKFSDDGTVTFNAGTSTDQVEISATGIKVGTGSAYINNDGFKAGADGKNSLTTSGLTATTIKAGTNNTEFIVDADGNVVSKGSVTANQAGFNNLAVTNGLTVGSTTGNFVNMQNGNVVATGSVTAKGGVNASEMSVAGATGSLNVKDIGGTSTMIYTKKADGTNTIWIDPATGNISTNGTLQVGGGVAGTKPSVTIDGATGSIKVGQNDTEKFAVDGTTGNVKTEGSLEVASNATVGGTLGVTGAATLGSTLEVTGTTTLKDELQVDKKATFGTVAGSQTVINGGDITADGNVTAKGGLSAANGKFTVNETSGLVTFGNNAGNQSTIAGKTATFGLDTGDQTVINGGAITAKSLTVDSFGAATITANDTLKVGTDVSLDKNGNLDLGTNTLTDAQLGNINNTIKAGQVIEAKSGEIGGVKFSTTGEISDVKNITAEKGTIGQVGLEGGKITANNGGTIAGVGFASNNVSGINNLTATGTIQGATLKVNDHNLLNSNGLKADSAVIDDLTIDGASITSNNADGSVGVAGITVDKTGAITGVKAIDGVAVAGNAASGLTIGSGATAVTIGGNSLALSSTGFNVDDDGDVTGKSFKVNGSNYLDSTGLTTGKAVIGGVNTLNDKGIDTSKNLHVGGQATFGDSTGTHTTINGGTITSTDGTDSTTIGPNKITTKTLEADTIILNDHMQDGAGNKIEIGADGHLNVAGNNFTIDTIGQLTNEYTGTDAAGRATKTTLKTSVDGINANYTNSVNNNNNLLNINQDGVALGVTDSSNNNLGMLSADANAATMGYGTANSIVVSADTIKSALGTDVTRVMTNNTTDKSIVDAVGTDASRTLKADEIVDKVGSTTVTTKSGGTTFSDGTTNTLINGSAITSTNGTATGVLNGSSLTLDDGTNSTVMNAGGVTFTGADGRSDATGVKNQTTIDGGIITTDTLNVQRIELGDKLVDSNGTSHGSNLSMDEYGNIKAAGGNFTVAGTNQTNPGALHNEVGGKTFLDTTETGASMKFDNTAATDGVKSEVSVEANKATVAAGDKASFVANTDNGGTATITGGTQTVTTTDAGTVFKNSAHKDPFGGGIVTETTINGNEITTGKITTDQLVIKGNGSGAAAGAGSGSIALGGNGSITSNIKNAATGKEATFKTDETGTFTEAKDSAGNKTTNTVNAQGNTNEVTDGTNTSTATQTATSIGGVVTNGTVKMKQELTVDGVKFEQTGYDEVNIAKGDVTVTNNRNTTDPQYANQTVNLSDLGSLNNLDGELKARDEYQNNQTAVGAINAEAGIRREEVARLDNRIDDVNNRVDKVGAMAAAIASLKSIGYDPQAPSEFSIGLGQYKGETGVAMGFFHYPNKNFMINVSLSTAGGETMGGIGATWRFGHKSPQKLLDEQREAQARKELAAAEKYQAAAKLAKEAQERAEYAAKLARQAQVSADNAKAAADATQAKHFQ